MFSIFYTWTHVGGKGTPKYLLLWGLAVAMVIEAKDGKLSNLTYSEAI